ncbi:amino acid transporter [Weissella uvarum]|uniref:APC family permease n=1 Tax=Weissella uvarum TaxID=1479233 RepID=UPI001961035E|nr:APC family permease [Weissella uvarum]MBM7617013.1 amino acid transporter [Weissella uvarum]MCM0595311.1 APC family permease [Weissella uvarum]
MKNQKMGLFQIVMLALGALIGSGWLFGSWEATKVAGPAAIFSWIIGAVVIGTIAYNYVELGTMFPESGGMSKYAQISHGSLLGFIAAWANWVSLIALIPIESIAAVQYMGSWPWDWATWTNHFFEQGSLTFTGYVAVVLFIIVFTLLNFWSVNLLTRFTSFISIFKIGIPALVIVMFTMSGFHPGNYGHSLGEFMPYGTAPIFAATTVAGIIFSFNAFQTVINMGSEIKKPERNIGLGIAISLGIATVIYVLLQSTYITSLKPSFIAETGWHGINFQSPFADLALMLGLHWLSVLLYMDAFVSPFGTGVSFAATASRTLAAMVSNNHMPKFIGKINERYGIPRIAMVVNAILSIILVVIFPSWSALASVISTSTLIAYLTGPVSVMSLRRVAPDLKRPFKGKLMPVMAPVAFVLASLATYWAMFPTTLQVIVVILLGLPFYFYYEKKLGYPNTKNAFKSSLWMLGYLVFISFVSFIGSTEFNGLNWLHYPWDFVIVIIGSLGFYAWGVRTSFKGRYFKEALPLNDSVVVEDN